MHSRFLVGQVRPWHRGDDGAVQQAPVPHLLTFSRGLSTRAGQAPAPLPCTCLYRERRSQQGIASARGSCSELDIFLEEKDTPVLHGIIYPIHFVSQKRFTLRRLMAQGTVREILQDCLVQGRRRTPPRRGRSSQLTRGAAGAGKGWRGWGSSHGAPSDGDHDSPCPGPGESRSLSPGQRQEKGSRAETWWPFPGVSPASRSQPRKRLTPVRQPSEQELLAAPQPLAQGGHTYHASYNLLMPFPCSWFRFPGSIPAGHVARLLGSPGLPVRAACPALPLHTPSVALTRGTAPEPQPGVRRAVRACVRTRVSASRAE